MYPNIHQHTASGRESDRDYRPLILALLLVRIGLRGKDIGLFIILRVIYYFSVVFVYLVECLLLHLHLLGII